MGNWKKTGFLAILIFSAVIALIFWVFNLKLVRGASDNIEFASQATIPEIVLDSTSEKPKNIVIFIADGLGFGHLSLAKFISQQQDSTPLWDRFPVKGWHDPRSVYGPLTDSEASATAMATGISTNFGHIGIDKDGNVLENVFELAKAHGYNTGIVTDSYVWDGTPAAFVAHSRNEDDARDLLNQIARSELDLLFGELEDLGEGDIPEKEESLEILSGRFQLLEPSLEIPKSGSPLVPIAAIYDEDEITDMDSSPNLFRLTSVALEYLNAVDEPFILLVECEEMDSASHINDSERVIKAVRTIQETLTLVLDYSQKQGESLVLFTSDHETGGLSAIADFNKYPDLQISWSTRNHTAAVVPLFASGPGSLHFAQVKRNWQIGSVLKQLIVTE